MEKIPDKQPPSGHLTDVHEFEKNRLSTLNEQLVQAEQWIDRRSREMVAAYGLAAAQARHGERIEEDLELVATVLFLLREDHPDFLHGQHNVVTRIDIPILPATRGAENVGHARRTNSIAVSGSFREMLFTVCEPVRARAARGHG